MDILPSVYRWIEQYREAGASDGKLVAALVFSHGYSLEVAQYIVRQFDVRGASLLPPLDCPRPDVTRNSEGDAVLRVDTFEGWSGRVIAELFFPQVLVIQGFAPERAITTLLAQYDDCKRTNRAGSSYVRGARDGLSMQCTGPAAEFAKAASKLLNWPVNRLDEPLVLSYEPGQKFDLHYDFYSARIPGHARLLERFEGNPRIGTLIVYLETPDEGGGTYFGNLGLRFQPEPGDAVYFGYPVDKFERCGTLHSGERVISGRKKIVTFAVHQKSIAINSSAATISET